MNVSYCELYNEKIRDLLVPPKDDAYYSKLQVGVFFVSNFVKRLEVRSSTTEESVTISLIR